MVDSSLAFIYSPSLPLRATGTFKRPQLSNHAKWAVDETGKCWCDFAHGGQLWPVEGDFLLSWVAQTAPAQFDVLERALAV